MGVFEFISYWMNEVLDHFKTDKICNENLFENVSDHLKTQEMCDKAFEVWPWQLYHIPDHLKIKEMCNKAVEVSPWHLKYVSDWFVTEQ